MIDKNGDDLASAGDSSHLLVERSAIRALVAKDQAELADVAQAGWNVHQRSLDQMDRVRAQIGGLSTEEQTRFLRIYTEETLASAAATNERAQLLEGEAASKQSFGEQVGRGLVAAVIVLGLFALCSR